MKKINIIFVEPNLIMNQGMAIFLANFEIVNKVSSLLSIKELQSDKIGINDLLILDTESNKDLEYLLKIKIKNPMLPILFLSSKERYFENYLFAQKHNIPSFLTKRINPLLLIEEIQKIRIKINAGIQLHGKPNKSSFESLFDSPPIFTLKETCILHFVARAKSNTEIGKLIGLSHRTVETHRRRIIEKMEGKNIIPALIFAIKKKYISIDFV